MRRFGPLFQRESDGTFTVALAADDREFLGSLADLLDKMVEAEPDDPWLRRLFPTAYPNDPEREQEWRLLMSVELHDKRREQLRVLSETASADRLTEDELHAWTQALNGLRLYLGTRLDVTEDTEAEDFEADDDRELFVLYNMLSLLQGEAIDALSQTLSPGDG